MIRSLIAAGLLSAVLAASACGSAASVTQLRVALYPNGRGNLPVRHYRLSCAPASGTVPRPGRACLTLARLEHPFAPVPAGTICSQIALGPQEAVVSGTLRGKRVDAHLSLRDSCEIARWRRLRTVVPGFPG